MEQDASDTLVAVVPPLLQALETLNFAARYLDPAALEQLIEAISERDAPLRAVDPVWPESIAPVGMVLDRARAMLLQAFDEFRAASESGDLRRSFRALRFIPRVNEVLYQLAPVLPPVNRHFLPTPLRADEGAQMREMGPPPRDDTGILHIENEAGSRGGFSLFVPQHYTPERPMPLVMALHGGSGNGRDFLWTWLRDARGYGAILVSPTAVGETWSLNGDDIDTPNLLRILEIVQANWAVDSSKLLMTGLSDGGTFCWVHGLQPSPFTHLAPVASSFHPVLAAMADPERMRGLPIFLTHGARDWMFSIDIARGANQALTQAGAAVTYREIDDLSHTYPREINPEILAWLNG